MQGVWTVSKACVAFLKQSPALAKKQRLREASGPVALPVQSAFATSAQCCNGVSLHLQEALLATDFQRACPCHCAADC